MSDKREKGSITVEAALFIPLFFFAFMCIFSLISCVRAQVLIQYSVDQAAKEVAEYSYILEKTGVLDAYKGLNSRSEESQVILLPRMTTNEIFWSIWVITNVEKT